MSYSEYGLCEAVRMLESARVSPDRFEAAVTCVLDSIPGWWARRTRAGPDRGVDVVFGAPGCRIAVQVKRYTTGRRVSAAEVREHAGVRESLDCDGAMLVTAGEYSTPAIQAASRLNIALLSSQSLATWAHERTPPLADSSTE